MQPTPRTSTSSWRPAWRTALSSASFTPLEFEDMQPAARQQRMVNFFAEARSFSVISSRSSMTMVEPSFHMFEGQGGSLTRSHSSVIDNCRSDSTGADATRREKGELIVGCRLAGFDARLLLDGGEHFVAAFDVAGSAHADHAGVL